jgi:small conductance mechanosensitive channel
MEQQVGVQLSTISESILAMVNGLLAALPNLVIGVAVFVVFFMAGRWVRTLVRQLAEQSGLMVNAGIVFARLAQWLMILAGTLVALSIIVPSFTAGRLIELLGVGGIAVGFAFRDIFENFLAGILLLLTEPFAIGDQIIVGDYEGTVEDIQTRATAIRTYDGRRVVIPNADLFTDAVTVNTAFPMRRSQYDVGIGYDADIETTRRLIRDAICGVDGVADDPVPDVRVVALADSSVNLRARWWTKSWRPDVVGTSDRVVTAIKYALDANDVDIPSPIRTVLLHDERPRAAGNGARELPT